MTALTMKVSPLVSSLLAKPGFPTQPHFMVRVALGRGEIQAVAPNDLVIVIDVSGSTGDLCPKSTESILQNAQAACCEIVDRMGEHDRVAVVAFSDKARVVAFLTKCDDAGKFQLQGAINGLWSDGDTDFIPALQTAGHLLIQAKDPGRKRSIIFVTDGRHRGLGALKPETVCEQLRQQGITFYVGGIGVPNDAEMLLEKMATVANFRSVETADELAKFFTDAQTITANAALTNTRLVLQPVTYMQPLHFELVARVKQLQYAPSNDTKLELYLGDIGVGDELQIYSCLKGVLPAGIIAGKRSFGKLELWGDDPAQGKQNQLLAQAFIVIPLSDLPGGVIDGEVKLLMHDAASARELYAASQANNTDEMQAHLAKAKQTAAFSNTAIAEAIKVAIAETAQAENLDQAAKAARKGTQAFDPQQIAAALAGIENQ